MITSAYYPEGDENEASRKCNNHRSYLIRSNESKSEQTATWTTVTLEYTQQRNTDNTGEK